MPEFHPYDGWEEDLHRLSREIAGMLGGCRVEYVTILATQQARRLLDAFEPPKCGKVLTFSLGTRRGVFYGDDGPVACDLARGHGCRCIPNVPAEAWRDA